MKKVSGYMILLNEAPTVQFAVRSIIPHVDELFIVDNGSTDGTIELVEAAIKDVPFARLTKRVQDGGRYSDEWNEPVLRNWCVDNLENDWVLTIDGDEFLAAGKDLFREVDKPVTLPTINLASNTHYILSERLETGEFPFYPDRHVRFWDRRKGHYSGQKRHSRIVNKTEDQFIFGIETDAVIWHYNALVKDRSKMLQNDPSRYVLLPLSVPPPVLWNTP